MLPEPESSDEDEGPGEESFADGKVVADNVRNLILEKKQKEKQELKLKRQKRQEMFVTQKQEKMARLDKRKQKLLESNKISLPSDSVQDIPSPLTIKVHPDVPDPQIQILRPQKVQSKRKFYKDYNIEVTTLNQLKNSRATKAIDFKSKRLAKPRRESVLINTIHAEKLKVAGKVLNKN